MQLLFLWENANFGINLFAALSFLACWWLYFDAWMAQRRFRELLGLFGWLLLALSFFLNAVHIETALLPIALTDNQQALIILIVFLRLLGYILVGLSVILDPLQDEPHAKGLTSSVAAYLPPFLTNLPAQTALPFTALLVAFAYWRRATTGLERHLKPVAWAFLLFSIHEIFGLGQLLRSTADPTIFRLVAPFGLVWVIEHLFLLLASVVLIRWVGQYLLRRLQSQLVMVFISMSLGVFLLTTVTFSTLLLQYMENATLKRLEADARTLEFMLNTLKEAVVSDAQLVAGNPTIKQLISNPEGQTELAILTRAMLLSKQESTLVITNADGQVIARGENSNQIGDSLSGDALVRHALGGQMVSGLVVKEGAVAPTLSLRAAVPITEDEEVRGVVMIGTVLDSAYVDGLKSATGLDAAFYAGDTLAATSITDRNTSNRWIGIQETDKEILDAVLSQTEVVRGAVTLLNIPYLAVYLPLTDINNKALGMLFVGTPQLDVMQTAGRSLQLTFATSVILMLFSLIPSTIVARKISGQVR